MTTRPIDVLVIGGSAGALEPLLQILRALPARLSMPIALVLHVAPYHPSSIPGLLSRTCSRRVREPEDKEILESNAIYIAPPNYHMLFETDGRSIALSVDDPVQFSRPSIDVLFDSAADAFGPRVAGILLSGTNSDGAEGLERIVRRGGLAIVQEPSTAEYDTMPLEALGRVPSCVALEPAQVSSYLALRCDSLLLEHAP